ncbi:MAG: NADH-quinone oxidoreductase subunit H [Pseudodesulfovibrio sp.]|uniref:Respiratory-chain NADH dehydrogenase subunit 1 n=1 Tax=Pseudodesulfovibrio aespoeensis (strain ATCC 700646 / DSM 10631 / Aspo-2) TaxID=643562 RepID=E6VU72_PSEA9|nr:MULTISPECIES: complex I subunit 1 family protein [Pseudodesulfovibrio]MBU4245187.1 NADH-quinone oxidoreductase subunit H [Pseudomonadota bacterium]ADU63379.1 respiratory-chain NADH dehydrogenase subunit 1 [Pseudodesulfovibrio aespoeensis Aspo-2]MBU4379879.1 NADH-quinone oxidoreductase subunit H [Pseudomonadota bacterium]MBU4517532.1 NADH-quinone oxidoreductase subunit H [Pseudomonadota bacterium]MBU4523639.1 NADH-quinone oxidoreductase subunit H [Pseudomonadota bacterium]
MDTLILVIIGLVAGPVLGGLIAGLDRRVTAWFQSRQGPPIMQAFYDVAKLLGKEKMVVNQWQILCAWVYMIAAAVSVALFFAQGDLLVIFFVQAVGAVFLVMGAMSAKSPYSQVGAQRELMQILAYEPVLILVFVGIYLVTGSFSISAVWELEQPLLAKMPLLYLALGFALTIKLRKSPFDFSTSHHGHQELVKGVLTEYSGPYLALIEIAHWYETVLVLGLCALFWSTNVVWMAVLLLGTYMLEILVDNTMARMTWRWMLKRVWLLGMGMSVVNLIWLYAG